ncbi:Gcv operon activator [Variovorax sp. PBS-H4]|uniref:transcriptional regulator GcvA n=1 Tax=Variovorax sp. PBS-H4 TaxID=434008 RepID=UPI0013169E52|nr:transcriptional regulator GcvA [Variovorax sp. PBS-H4]VTU41184.1 Gcv operon activator [Variovorax sp. PBS-H4]
MRALPPLNSIKAFDAAARHLSFTKAGDELCVTHGAISRQIQLLEQWLGTALFLRLPRGLQLTNDGMRFHTEVNAMLNGLASVADQIRHPRTTRIIRVQSLPTFTMRWLIPRLPNFQRRYPDIEIRLSIAADAMPPRVNDFEVFLTGGPESHHGFRSGRFLDEQRIAVAAPELLRRSPIHKPDDLKQHVLLHASSLPALWSNWFSAAGSQTVQGRGELTFEHLYLSIQAAVNAVGVAIGPTALVADDIHEGRLQYVMPQCALPARSYFWYSPERTQGDAAVDSFCAWLLDVGNTMPEAAS